MSLEEDPKPMVKDKVIVDRVVEDEHIYFVLPSKFEGKFLLVCESFDTVHMAHIEQEHVDELLAQAKPKSCH